VIFRHVSTGVCDGFATAGSGWNVNTDGGAAFSVNRRFNDSCGAGPMLLWTYHLKGPSEGISVCGT
jgi:hypothetical protein